MDILNADRTIRELLELFPDGFTVSPCGRVYRTILSSSRLPVIGTQYPLPPPAGGYLVVDEPHVPGLNGEPEGEGSGGTQ